MSRRDDFGRMAGAGGQTTAEIEEFTRAIDSATQNLSTFDRAVAAGARGSVAAARHAFSQTAGFSANLLARRGQSFARQAILGGVARNVSLGGREGIGQSITNAVLQAGASMPVIGSVFSGVTGPLQSAGGRTAGITTMIARAGGTVTPELRKSLMTRFLEQEKRSQKERKDVEALAGSKEMIGIEMQDSQLGESIDVIIDLLNKIASATGTLGRS